MNLATKFADEFVKMSLARKLKSNFSMHFINFSYLKMHC